MAIDNFNINEFFGKFAMPSGVDRIRILELGGLLAAARAEAELFRTALRGVIECSNEHGFWNKEQVIAELALDQGVVLAQRHGEDYPIGLRFVDIVARLIAGKKFRRKSWIAGIYIRFNPNMKFVELYGKASSTKWSPYKDDFVENDWEEVE